MTTAYRVPATDGAGGPAPAPPAAPVPEEVLRRLGARVVAAEAGDAVQLASGIGVRLKIDGGASGGAFEVVEHPLEPGALAWPHTHTREDECSYVLQGRLGVLLGDRTLVAEPGAWVFKPRGVRHAFWNPGPGPARFLEVISPAGFGGFFRELGALLQASGGEPDGDAVAALAGRYGLAFHMEDEAPLREAVGLPAR